MSNVYPITQNFQFSYKVNDVTTTMTYAPDEPYYITINSLNDVSLTLTPSVVNNVKWTNVLTYYLTISNLSSSVINDFAIKLNSPSNLSYISGTLVNSHTGEYYPLRDWTNEFDVIAALPANSSLKLKYCMQVTSNTGNSVISPVVSSNSGSYGSATNIINSNASSLNISEPRIVVNNSNYSFQNTGTIPYSFQGKFTIPTGKSYQYAMLDYNEFTNLVYRQLGSYAIFTIYSLPPATSTSTATIPNILRIIFG